jgi:hypothetical protein
VQVDHAQNAQAGASHRTSRSATTAKSAEAGRRARARAIREASGKSVEDDEDFEILASMPAHLKPTSKVFNLIPSEAEKGRDDGAVKGKFVPFDYL